jgi:hypothetical protein
VTFVQAFVIDFSLFNTRTMDGLQQASITSPTTTTTFSHPERKRKLQLLEMELKKLLKVSEWIESLVLFDFLIVLSLQWMDVFNM